ncbi:MAG TPA: HAMP domain-containing sensor histidine kinase [Candidatus Dormibacteraeota bacterium]|nr:HAMP domain-containing sensor histidine kinase [Candidatus Dormibacteraeota bacterium]
MARAVGPLALRLRLAALIAALLLSVAALGLVGLGLLLNATATTTAAAGPGFLFAIGPDLADAIQVVSIGPTVETTALGLAPADLPLVAFSAWLVLVVPSLAVAWRLSGRMLRPVEATVAALNERYEVRELQRRRLVDDAAHEVRNPLAVMRTNIDVALSDPADTANLRTAAEVSRRAGERIERTVDDLRREFHDGAHAERRTPVDLAALAEEIGQEYRVPAGQRGLAIHVDAASGLQVTADRAALKGALSNLVSNALRYAPVGSPVHIGAGSRDGWRWIGVRDFGPGVAAPDQALVFRHAWRAEGQASDGGSGIGLALVRQVAEAHGGAVRLTSVPRGGSSFVLWLPAREGSVTTAAPAGGDPLWEATAAPSA